MKKLLKDKISRRDFLRISAGLGSLFLFEKLYDDDFIGIAEAKDIRYNPEVWYNRGKRGSFDYMYLDASTLGPPNEECWEAYEKGWYDWYLRWWGKKLPKDKVLTKKEFEETLPLYMISTARTKFYEWPPKNAIGYQPKVKLLLTDSDEEKREILKLKIAPVWKHAYGWWPDGPKKDKINLEFVDDPISATYSAGFSPKYALLDTDDDEIPEIIAVENGPGPNWYGVVIPTFIQGENGEYIILHHDKWKGVHVEYPALEKKKKYPKLYDKLEEEGFTYLGSVYEKDLIRGIPFDIQKPPESLIIEKSEKPEPTPTMPSSGGPIPTIPTPEHEPTSTPQLKVEKTPGFGIEEALISLAAAGATAWKVLGSNIDKKKKK